MRMYVAIEGIKGTGKSSITKEVQKNIAQKGEEVRLFAITKAMPHFHPLELLHRYHPILKERDSFLEQLFAHRAIWQQKQAKSIGNILGDRSIVTSYVTRWTKWGDPYYTIKRTHKYQSGIQPPQAIIWLKCPANIAYQNIQKRTFKGIGKVDEGIEKLQAAAVAYEELFTEKLYPKKIGRADIIEVPAYGSLDEVTVEITEILKHYYKL